MFDTINEKLNDESFLQQAMKEVEAPKEAKGKDDKKAAKAKSSKAPDGMTEEDEKCYEARFSDLNKKKGREHFQDVGSDQGRLRTCAGNLTDYQTQRYLDNNPDLQHEYGRKGKSAKA
jgi:hypothetical protein